MDAVDGSGAGTTERAAIGSADAAGSAAMFAADTASRAAGVRLDELGEHAATVSMLVRDDMLNGHGITHGGYVFLLADTAFALACNWGGDAEGTVTVAAGVDIVFLRATRGGDRLVATARRRSGSGRSGVYDVTVTTAEHPDRVVAEFRGRSRTLAAPAAAS